MDRGQSQTQRKVLSLLDDSRLASRVAATKTKVAAVKLLVEAAEEKGVALTAPDVRRVLGEDKVPRLTSLSREQLLAVASRAMLRPGGSLIGHTCSCYHCIKKCSTTTFC